jgi:hypothetical protein
MSEKSKHNIEELLNEYVDGELSERKYTELKRMMEHDPELLERFNQLKKQKQILNAMPVEAAPAGLLDEVVGSMERKLILNEYSAVSVESEGIKNLIFRRLMTAAVAMVLFGGLGGLIYKIIAPPKMESSKELAVIVEDTDIELSMGFDPVKKDLADAIVDNPVFRASLHLKTEHAIAMNSFIKKSIFNHDMNGFVNPPENEGTSSTVRITCGIDRIVELVNDLQSEWDKCKEADLSIYDHALAREIVIERISSKQLVDVFSENKFYTRMQVAKDYADFNRLNPYGNRILVASNEMSNEAVMPELTSVTRVKSQNRLDGGEKISLVITVTGL